MLKMAHPQATLESERGVVLIVVLIVATIFAVLAYTALAVTLNSLENTDSYRHSYIARQVAEGSVHEAAYALLVDPAFMQPGYIDPYDVSFTEEELRGELISADRTYAREFDTFPVTIGRTAYTVSTNASVYHAETDVIPGDRDEAVYRYLDDETFSSDYPAYEFAPVKTDGDLVVFGVGEVDEPEGDTSLFSFVRGEYHNVQWTYDVRETGISEPSRLGPYPYIETQHPYGVNETEGWVVTYSQDPRHPGRNVTDIRLKANEDRVGIDAGDWLYIAGWLADERRFQNFPEIRLENRVTNYANGTDEVLSRRIDPDGKIHTTSLGLYWRSDEFPPETPGKKYGFRVSGVRYDFDHDEFGAYYETPHPYDLTIDPLAPLGSTNSHVVYGMYQARPWEPVALMQQMKIKFDDRFSLDGTDQLYVFNASNPDCGAGGWIERYDVGNPLPAGGWSPVITRANPDLPLGALLVLVRAGFGDTDGEANFGYKVVAMEYTDANGDWVHMDMPVIQSPHRMALGANSLNITLPLPAPPVMNLTGYQTIYRPSVPNRDNASGLGKVTNWYVSFSDMCNLTASNGMANVDFVRLTTPGNLLPSGTDTMYFVHAKSALGVLIGVNPEYFQIDGEDGLQKRIVDCGVAQYLQIEFFCDKTDEHEGSEANFGYRVSQVAYDTDDGVDDDPSLPTIRTDVVYPENPSYPAYGYGFYEYAEWWYTNKDADPVPLVVGLHFDRLGFDIEPMDWIEIYDQDGVLVASLTASSMRGGPGAGGPGNPDFPGGGSDPGGGPGAGGPELPAGVSAETVVDLSATYGWVLVPGPTAKVVLVGDGQDNEGYAGFEIDRCAYVNGDLTEIRAYIDEYVRLAYDQYVDRSAEPLSSFRTLGFD